MKRFLLAAALSAAFSISIPALAADVGLSLSIGEPGFFGRLDVGNFPPPPVLYRQPIMVERGAMNRPPVYLRVPPGHAKHWRKHCHEYNACNEQVYFVQDNWYNREYAPRYRKQHGDSRDEHRGDSRNDRRGDSGDDHRGNQGNEHRGRGRD